MDKLVSCAICATAYFLMSGAAVAGSCGYAYCWGAVGIGSNGAYGFAAGQWSENDAYNTAQNGCGGNCQHMQTFYNTCGAMASSPNGAWGAATGGSRYRAEREAVSLCVKYNGYNCEAKVWACSQ